MYVCMNIAIEPTLRSVMLRTMMGGLVTAFTCAVRSLLRGNGRLKYHIGEVVLEDMFQTCDEKLIDIIHHAIYLMHADPLTMSRVRMAQLSETPIHRALVKTLPL